MMGRARKKTVERARRKARERMEAEPGGTLPR